MNFQKWELFLAHLVDNRILHSLFNVDLKIWNLCSDVFFFSQNMTISSKAIKKNKNIQMVLRPC